MSANQTDRGTTRQSLRLPADTVARIDALRTQRTPKASRALWIIEEIVEKLSRGHTYTETLQLLSMMSEINREKVQEAKRAGMRMVGGIYKRTRKNENGRKVQQAEIRFDDISGCLRTPAGGSGRQVIMVVHKNTVRTRLISSREIARLMGAFNQPTPGWVAALGATKLDEYSSRINFTTLGAQPKWFSSRVGGPVYGEMPVTAEEAMDLLEETAVDADNELYAVVPAMRRSV